MELRHLKYFKAVAEELHFGRAAARLNIAQPPLSLQIRQLEAELGVTLFHRTKRNVELTKEGEVFLDKVEQLLINLDESIEVIRMVKRGEVGKITIGFIASAAYDILPLIIKHYRKQFPSVQVVLKQLTSADQLKALQEHIIEVGIISEPVEHENFHFEVVKEEPMIVALPKEHPLAYETSAISLIDLSDDPFIITARIANQRHYDGVINCCYQAGFSPKIIQETGEMSTVLSLVSAGIGVALVPSSLQLLLQKGIVYRAVGDHTFHTVNALAWRKDNQSPVVQAFSKLVKETVIPIFNHS